MIFLVEDDYYITEYLRNIARLMGVDIDAASTYQEAKQKIKKRKYEAYIIDINLPDGTGLDLLETIREVNGLNNISLMTINLNNSTAKFLQEKHNVNHILRKPVNENDLLDLLLKITDKKIPIDEDDFLAELRQTYEKNVFDKIAFIEKILENICSCPTSENVGKLKFELHKIAGSAGSYGYPEASNVCKNFEMQTDKLLAAENFDKNFWTLLSERIITDIKQSFQKINILAKHSQFAFSEKLKKHLHSLTQTYADNLSYEINNLYQKWQYFIETQDKTVFSKILFSCHKFAGSAGSFGFPNVGECLTIVHTKLSLFVEEAQKDLEKEIEKLFLELQKYFKEEYMCFNKTKKVNIKALTTQKIKRNDSLVYLWQIDDISLPYQKKRFSCYQELEKNLTKELPLAVIIDIDNLVSEVFWKNVQDIRNKTSIIFIAEKDDFTIQLTAIRNGVDVFLKKPLSENLLHQQLLKIIQQKENQPYAVLVVDDDPILLENYSLVLKKSRMIPKSLSSPQKIIKVLKEFVPDVILLDVNMPGCNGIEVAKIIRQQVSFSATPIIFLSMEKDFDKRLAAMEHGDAFLQKPISPAQLIAAVKKWGQKSLEVQAIKKSLVTNEIATENTNIVYELQEERIKRKRLEDVVDELQKEIDILYHTAENGELNNETKIIGSQGDSYVIKSTLARGGMGITYLALRESDQQKVVIKTLNPRYQKDPRESVRFFHEAKCIMAITHTNLVKGYDYYQGQNSSCIIMEYVSGKTISEILDKQEKFSATEACKIIRDIADGLICLEEKGIVHRDIKPQNIIINEQGIPKLVDFGIVKISNHEQDFLTSSGIVLGTPYYVCPEQLYCEELDTRSDIYSLGATFYHMVTGTVPFSGNSTLEVLHKRLVFSPNPQNIEPTLPSAVVKIIRKMMCISIQRRYQTAVELKDALNDIINS